MGPKKEARPKRPGTPYALRRNIFRKRQKTMVCLAFGELILGVSGGLIALFGVRIDPPQDFLEMGLDRLVAPAGAVAHGFRVADQDRAAPSLQRAFRLEGLNDPAGIGAADAQ